MTAYEYLKKHVVSILKPSHVGGVGYFAVRDIKKGELIFNPWYGESGVHSITHEELSSLPEDLQKSIYETFDNKIFYLDKDGNEQMVEKEYGKIFILLEKGYHWLYIYPAMFINSGLQNANVDTEIYNPVATRDIKKGEELLANYGSKFKFKPKNFI
jgi:SET domain-containing protein